MSFVSFMPDLLLGEVQQLHHKVAEPPYLDKLSVVHPEVKEG